MSERQSLLDWLSALGLEPFVLAYWMTASNAEVTDKLWRLERQQEIELAYPGLIGKVEELLQALTALGNHTDDLGEEVKSAIDFLKQLQGDIVAKEIKEESIEVDSIGNAIRLDWRQELVRIEQLLNRIQNKNTGN